MGQVYVMTSLCSPLFWPYQYFAFFSLGKMFIKKDKRKIPQILADPEDNREYLKLAKRSFEFQSGVKIICSESNLSALKNLKVFNLYDNGINDLTVGLQCLRGRLCRRVLPYRSILFCCVGHWFVGKYSS
jgi:hypothetical protein